MAKSRSAATLIQALVNRQRIATIAAAISNLEGPANQGNRLGAVNAVIFLSTWLRSPADTVEANATRQAARSACALAYAEQRFNATSWEGLTDEQLSFVLSNLSLRNLSDLTHQKIVELGEFDLPSEFGFNELRVIADTVKFLLYFDPKAWRRSIDRPRARSTSSLNNAYDFLSNFGGFGRCYADGRRAYASCWRKYSRASSFLYIHEHTSTVNLLVDPRKPNFADDIDEMLKFRGTIRSTIRQSKWVSSELEVRLSKKAPPVATTATFPAKVALEKPMDALSAQDADDYFAAWRATSHS